MTFGSPIWLYLIPLALAGLVAADVFTRRGRRRALERFAAPALLQGLLSAYSIGRARFKTGLLALAIVSLFVALARPQVGYEWREVKAKGVDLVIAMDVSMSMLARDIKPDRLERAKLAVLDLIEQLKGDRIGLVAFAGEAFLQCPLTLDYDAFRQSLEALSPSVIPREGTDLGAAIAESVAAFDVTSNEKIVVLITDGEDLEGNGLAQAKLAAQKGVVIYTVGVGTAQGELIPIRDERGQADFLRDQTTGKIVTTRLEDATLKRLAQDAHGFYTPLGPTGEGLWKVYESGWKTLKQDDVSSRQQRTPIERFQWPLALSIFLLAWEPIIGTRKRFFLRLFRRAGVWLVACALAGALFANARADELAAQSAYAQGDYEAAATQWATQGEDPSAAGRLHFNQGASFYKLGDYPQAAKAFTAALAQQAPGQQKDAFFNLGNTRFMQGIALEQSNAKEALSLWEQALKDYDNAIELAPDDKDAAHNRAYVQQRIDALKKREEEKKKQQQQQQQNQQNQDQQNQDQKNQDQQNSSQQNQSSQNNPNQDQKKDQENQDQNSSQNQQNSQRSQDQKQDQKQDQQDKQPQDQSSSQNQDQKQNESSDQNKDKQAQKDKDQPQGQSGESKKEQEKQTQDEKKSGQGDEPKPEPKPEEKKNEPGKDAAAAQDKQDSKEKAQPEGSGKDQPKDKPQPPRDTRGDARQDIQEQRGPDNKGIAEAPKPAEPKPSAEEKAAAAAQAAQAQQAKEDAEAARAAEAAGVMNRQDAGFLLDSLKTQERKLPAAPIRVGTQPQDNQTRQPFKNW